MKHCLKQREKLKKKFTFVTTGFDGPWEKDEVTINFQKQTKKKDDYHKFCSRISMWGTDDFGMELLNVCEKDFRDMINLCIKTNNTPSIDVLKKMGYIFC